MSICQNFFAVFLHPAPDARQWMRKLSAKVKHSLMKKMQWHGNKGKFDCLKKKVDSQTVTDHKNE